jgi:glutaredoxin
MRPLVTLFALVALTLAPADAARSGVGVRPAVAAELGVVTVYGAKWCGPCHSLQDALKERSIPFDYVDIDENPGAWSMARKASGSNGIPTTSIKRGPYISWVIGSDANAVERAYKGDG